jgi:hypothetical protein
MDTTRRQVTNIAPGLLTRSGPVNTFVPRRSIERAADGLGLWVVSREETHPEDTSASLLACDRLGFPTSDRGIEYRQTRRLDGRGSEGDRQFRAILGCHRLLLRMVDVAGVLPLRDSFLDARDLQLYFVLERPPVASDGIFDG